MTVLQHTELFLLSRGMPVAKHFGVEIRAPTENAASARRALELIHEFGSPHLTRVVRHSRTIVQSVRPTSYSSHEIRALYLDFDALWHESMLATILIYNASTARARSMLEDRSSCRFSDETWLAICAIGVERCMRFMSWYNDKYDLSEGEHEAIIDWVRSFPATSTRRARMRGLANEARMEARRLVAWLRRFHPNE